MSRDHIIPQFILRGFAINPTANKRYQKIKIYDTVTKKVKTEFIEDAFQLEDFNSQETENYLANKYEDKVAKIFQIIQQDVTNDKTTTTLSNEEYRLLFRFFIIMWRRNDKHVEDAKKMCNNIHNIMKNVFGSELDKMIKPEYKNINTEEYFEKSINDISKSMYDKIIQETDDNDPTVLKTIKYYYPTIINNQTDINFILHNTYGTINYVVKNGSTPNYSIPEFFIEPISSKLAFLLLPREKEIDIEQDKFEIQIENWDNDKEIKEIIIDNYIIPNATSFVVDNTNMELIKEKYEDYNVKL